MKISLHMHVATLFLGCVWNKYVATFFLVSLVLSVKITSLQVITVGADWIRVGTCPPSI